MEKKNIMLKNSWIYIFLCIFLSGCTHEEIEFIEITEGRGMNPSEPRIGVRITSNNELYLCKEIIIDGRKTEKYKYYKNTHGVDFQWFKNDIVNNFDENIEPTYIKISDATYYQLFYKISSQVYKSRFTEKDLTNSQSQVLFKVMNLSKLKNYKEIPKHEFSKELLEEELPDPPAL